MRKNIKTFIFYPCALAMMSLYAYAQVENTKDAVLEQDMLTLPDDEHNLRNPFQPYVPPREESVVQETNVAGGPQEAEGTPENEFDYYSLRVTGSVWGNNMPKAIINDQVMGIGDVVNEAKILNITKDGILFEFKDKQHLMKR